MSFDHYILTRFNVEAEFAPSMCIQDYWLEHRFPLFIRYCLPSIAAQTCKNFTWLLMMDNRTPIRYKDRLNRLLSDHIDCFHILLTDANWTQATRSYIINDNKSDSRHIITTRCDNDDALHKEFIAGIQREFAWQDYTFIEFAKGYSYQPKSATLRWAKFEGNAFVSLVEKRSKELTTAFCGNHRYLREKGPFIVIPDPPSWLHVMHERNAINKHAGILVIKGAGKTLKRHFGFELTFREKCRKMLWNFYFLISGRKYIWPRTKKK